MKPALGKALGVIQKNNKATPNEDQHYEVHTIDDPPRSWSGHKKAEAGPGCCQQHREEERTWGKIQRAHGQHGERIISLLVKQDCLLQQNCLHFKCAPSMLSCSWDHPPQGSGCGEDFYKTDLHRCRLWQRPRSGGGGLFLKSCLTFATPWTVAHQAPLFMGFPRQEY